MAVYICNASFDQQTCGGCQAAGPTRECCGFEEGEGRRAEEGWRG